MADVYGVTGEDVSEGMTGLFPQGFNVTTKPTLDRVKMFISTADTIVTLAMRAATGSTPSAGDDNALLARSYIINATKAEVMRDVYTGNAPQDVAAASKPFDDLAKLMLERIDALERATTVATAFGFNSMPSSSTRHEVEW